MPFNRDEVSKLLVEVHRRCCICHRFCGVKIETDHIVPGDDSIENAIPVCFDCHAEIHSYNDQHPRGRKFLPEELCDHKAQWLQLCRDRPDILVSAFRTADVGPLQALIDELEFNMAVSRHAGDHERGAQFADNQFRRAIEYGAIAVLEPDLKNVILEADAAMSCANQRVLAETNRSAKDWGTTQITDAAKRALQDAKPKVEAAHKRLLEFFGSYHGGREVD